MGAPSIAAVPPTTVGGFSYGGWHSDGRGPVARGLGGPLMLKKSLPSAVASLLLVLVAGLVSVGAAPAGAVVLADEEMSEQRAGRYYLRDACEANEAQVRFSRTVFGPDNSVSFAEIRRRLPEFKRAAGALAPPMYRWARSLLNPPAPWPSSVANPVDSLASKLLRMEKMLRSASVAVTARGFYNQLSAMSKLTRSFPSATIRARLDLPPPGRGC